jgi:adenine-specific DNA-methyltransferase
MSRLDWSHALRALGGLHTSEDSDALRLERAFRVSAQECAIDRLRQSPESSDRLGTVDPMVTEVMAGIEERRRSSGEQLDPARRTELGQFFTPTDVAAFMADLLDVRPDPITLLDPGAGVGSLTAAVAAKWSANGGGRIEATVVERDKALIPALDNTLRELSTIHEFRAEIVQDDFVEWGANRVSGFGVLDGPRFDLVVMNPPYRKIRSSSPERRRMSGAGIEVPNLYAGFVALAARLLNDDGQLVAITPRSFTNGPYFRRFRHLLLETLGLRRVHVFDARDLAFADSEVLQENVIFSGVRGRQPASIVVSSSRSVSHAVRERVVPYSEVVRPDDPQGFLYITVDERAAAHARQMSALPSTLSDNDLKVCTGPVVDFRSKDYLRSDPEPGTVPLIYPAHLRGRSLTWPIPNCRKPNAIVRGEATERLLMPAGVYVVVKRFSAKEEPRRVVATVIRPADLSAEVFGFENHLNVFHRRGMGLPEHLAVGLAAFLNTTVVDEYFRQFNGHTQVNATDLRSLRYPTTAQLVALGKEARCRPTADPDTLISEVLPGVPQLDEARLA